MNAIEALHYAHKLFPEMPSPNYIVDVAAELCVGRLEVYSHYGPVVLQALNDLPGLQHLYYTVVQGHRRIIPPDLSATCIESLHIASHDFDTVYVPHLPTTLSSLGVVGAGRVEFAGPFPAGLHFLNMGNTEGDCVQCLPALPAGLKALFASDSLRQKLTDIPPDCRTGTFMDSLSILVEQLSDRVTDMLTDRLSQ